MCQSETVHQITDLFSVNDKKGKTKNDITDNKDSNNNNKWASVTVSVKTEKKKKKKIWEKVLQTFTIQHQGSYGIIAL